MRFEQWLATLLDHPESQVKILLTDSTALHFLIAWSIFESKCFKGFIKINDLEAFAAQVVGESFDIAMIDEVADHFHARYQDRNLLKNLMHSQVCSWIDPVLNKTRHELSEQEVVCLVALTVYRFRNNIFHGNKGIDSWLKFKQQIGHCTDALKAFVSHAERRNPSLLSVAA